MWISTAVVAVALVVGASMLPERRSNVEPVAFVDAPTERGVLPSAPTDLEIGSTGSALATAAFGLSALQPETYNSQIVIDIIEASPLEYGEKDRLTAKLMAAEAGRAELPRVLADIRVSLAIE